MIRLVSQKSKTYHICKNSEMFKQKRFLSCSKGFARFGINVSGEVHLQKSCRSQVFNFTKDRLHRVVPLGIWKIFRTAILWRSAVSYFHYYVMSQSFYFFISRKSFLVCIYLDGDIGKELPIFCLIIFH